jgi:hypothetical protein
MTRLAAVALLVLSACGYRLAGTASNVPAVAKTVNVHFRNHTREAGLDVHLRRAIEDEIRRRGALQVVEDAGDLTLDGDIRRFATIPVAFSAADEAVQYQGIMQVHFRLVDRATGAVIFEQPLLQETQDFGAVSGVVIASSPHFQRGTMDARDLASLTNVQIGEARRHDAQRDLVIILARDIYQQAMEGF